MMDNNAESPTSSGAAHGSASEAYLAGFKCGRSAMGTADENPHKHRNSKKRKDWQRGWLDGGAVFLAPPYEKHNGSHQPCDNANGPCACGAWHKPSDWPNVESSPAAVGGKEQ